MSPSSPVSVEGTFPSSRTLLVGVVQVCLVVEVKFEHLPVLDDPFTVTKSVSEEKYCTGITMIKMITG